MSASDRQSRLLVAEDWKRIYQSYRNADFQSYDFDNLRRTMINYLRQNYPEDFNDYIESSEYLALIDMIAFLGQNLSFRIDLNARENFLETAERRESVLRLARMLSYNPRRNQAANGLLRIETLKTTESVFDSTGLNLANVVIKWNDLANSNYFEQFIKVLNAGLPLANSIGNPLKSATIADVVTQKYRFNATNTSSAVFPFAKRIEGVGTKFEVVSSDIQNDSIVEEPPLPGTSPAFLFRDDGQGAGSSNTGFFMHFRQGTLDSGNFTVNNPTPNQSVAIDATDINNSDVWLYETDTNGFETNAWTKIDAVEGNNVIYNSLFQGLRNVYTVTTRVGDRINLVFSDGIFGNLPAGSFKVYYRSSANAYSTITPGAMGLVSIEIPYQSKAGSLETLTLGLRLKYTVSNSAPSETDEEIKQNAPATYYTQNRLITGEDYNVGPLAISQDIIKTKSSNRISSGISRFFDLKDASGKYSNTSLFADDGVIYKDEFLEKTSFTFATQSDIEGVLYNVVEPILSSINTRNFYLGKYANIIVSDLNATWTKSSFATNRTTGLFKDIDDNAYAVGSFTANSLRLIESGTMCRFVAPLTSTGQQQYFKQDGTLTTNANLIGVSAYKWSKVIAVATDGTVVNANGIGPIMFNDYIEDSVILDQIIPKFSRTLINDVKTQIIDQAFSYKDFGLRYDANIRQWVLITDENINTINNFALGKAGDTSGQNLDSSWLLYFKTDGEKYTITYRNLRYIFESADEIRFFFDKADKVYNPNTGQVFRDKIDILNINRQVGSLLPFSKDYSWTIADAFRDNEGYVDSRKIQIQFIDSDDDSVVDDPEMFEQLISQDDTSIAAELKIIFQKKYTTTDGVEDFKYFPNENAEITVLQNEAAIAPYSTRTEGQLFYLIEEDVFRVFNKSLNNTTINTDYTAYPGRAGLKFHYVHVADSNYRIDPSASNIIDTYVLTKTYDENTRKYINGTLAIAPRPPSNDELYRVYGPAINAIKSISDEVIYHPVKYKILFGTKANKDLQVKFKIVKNKSIVLNDNELKADVISAIDQFFAIENWDFGETFYFQELSAYIMNQLSPKLVSIIIVPRQGTQSFGSLFEIKSEPDEIFLSAAQVSDVETIDEITATELQASGTVITSVSTSTTSGITSALSTSTTNTGGGITTNSTGSSY